MKTSALFAALLALPAGALSAQESRTFSAPHFEGRRLDLCLVWGEQCGQPAADAWCRTQGYERASGWQPAPDIGAQGPTVVMTGGRLCEDPGCDGFAAITCVRGTTAPPAVAAGAGKAFPAPAVEGVRVDWCLNWGRDCGKPAADRFCALQGLGPAGHFEPAPHVGPTRVLGSGQTCGEPACDGFKVVVCSPPTVAQARPGRLVPIPPPAQPPPAAPQPAPAPQPPDAGDSPAAAAEPWTTQDVIDPRIDEQAQYALMRMFVGEEAERTDASNILSAVKAGALGGIYQEDQGVPAKRALKLGVGWWQLLPPATAKPRIDGICVTQPAGELPINVMRKGAHSNRASYDWALRDAWSNCGIEAAWAVRGYKVTLPAKQPPVKEAVCPNYVEGLDHSAIYVVVTAHGESLPRAVVQMSIPDNVFTREASETGVAYFELTAPESALIRAEPPVDRRDQDHVVVGEEEHGSSAVPLLPGVQPSGSTQPLVIREKRVEVLPSCIHTVSLDLGPG